MNANKRKQLQFAATFVYYKYNDCDLYFLFKLGNRIAVET